MPVYRKSMADFGQTLILLAQMIRQDRMQKEFAANAFRNEQTPGRTVQIPLGGAFAGETASMTTAPGPMTQVPNYQAILSGLLNPSTQGAASNLMQGLALMPKIQDPGGLKEFTAKEGIRTGFNVQEAQEKAKISSTQPKGSPRYYRDEEGNVRFGIPPETGTTPYDEPSGGSAQYYKDAQGNVKFGVPPETGTKPYDKTSNRPTVRRTARGMEAIDPLTGQSLGVVAGNPLPAETVQQLADARTTYGRLADVADKAEKLKDKFGPIEGRWNNLKVKFVNDGATQEVINELKSMITIAYSLSGKQISYREMEILQEAMLPRLEQPYENFKATLNFAKNWLAQSHNNRLDYYLQSGYGSDIKKLGDDKQSIPGEETKVINGKTYVKKNGQWYESK